MSAWPAFEEREAVGVEQGAAVGRQAQGLVPHAAVDGAEGREQPGPGVGAALEHLLAVPIGLLAQLGAERRDGVVGVADRIAQEQQAPLLGREQEDEPHHDREGRLVQPLLAEASKQLAPAVLVDAVERLDQHLDRLAHLVAELVGDLLLVLGALRQQRLERRVLGDTRRTARRRAARGRPGA